MNDVHINRPSEKPPQRGRACSARSQITSTINKRLKRRKGLILRLNVVRAAVVTRFTRPPCKPATRRRQQRRERRQTRGVFVGFSFSFPYKNQVRAFKVQKQWSTEHSFGRTKTPSSQPGLTKRVEPNRRSKRSDSHTCMQRAGPCTSTSVGRDMNWCMCVFVCVYKAADPCVLVFRLKPRSRSRGAGRTGEGPSPEPCHDCLLASSSYAFPVPFCT